MKLLIKSLSVAALSLFILGACTRVSPTHVATLEPSPGSSAEGSATARLALERLTVEGTFSDLSSNATGAELIDNESGDVVFLLSPDEDTSGSFSGAGNLNSDERDSLQDGNFRIVIYSEDYPDAIGELSGNLRRR